MSLNVIMFAILYPTMLILYFVFKKMGAKAGKYNFGVALKKEWLEKEEYKEIEENFNKQMHKILLVLMLLPVVCFLTEYVSIQFTFWMLWFCFGLMFLFVPYVNAFERLKKLKKVWKKAEEDLENAGLSEEELEEKREAKKATRYVELGAVGQIRRLNAFSYIPEILLNVLAAALVILYPYMPNVGEVSQYYSEMSFDVVVGFAGTSLVMIALAYWIDRMSMEVISEEETVNANYNRAKKQAWKQTMKVLVWSNTLLTLGLGISLILQQAFALVLILGCVLECLLMMVAFYFLAKKNKSISESYREKMDQAFDADDEDNWYWGFIYYNPKDSRGIVEHRLKTGFTTNMARPVGKIFLGIGVVGILVIPIMCVWMIWDEMTPRLVYVKDHAIICDDHKVVYEIPFDEVTCFTYPAELPEERTKTVGSNYDDFEKGEEKYFISCENQEDTDAMAECLKAYLSKKAENNE